MPRATMIEIAQRIREAKRVWLACHVRPDADTLGSLLALAEGIEAVGPRVLALSPDGVPETYRFLPGWERITAEPTGACDVAIGLDADGSPRLGPLEAAMLAAPCVVDLDHHPGPAPYGHLHHVDPTAAATGELVFALLRTLETPLTPTIARNLMAALVTDTGSFHFRNTTARTLAIARELMEAGAHPSESYEQVYGTRPAGALRLLGRILADFQLSADGRVVWACVPHAEMRELQVREEQTEGFINELRSVDGSQVAILFREQADGEVRISLRSRGEVDVAAVAAQFNGGGHKAASGCSLPGPLPKAIAAVTAAAEQAVRRETS